MKKLLLSVTVLSLSLMAFGQELQKDVAFPADDSYPSKTSLLQQAPKGGGDIIWQTSFDWANPDDPRGWTPPDGWEIVDNSDVGNYWIWARDSFDNGYSMQATPSFFRTGDDGFIHVPIRAYNTRDGVETATPADSYIQTAPIDCSSASSVVVRFTQYFRLCCSNYHLELMVSSDFGVHWANYDVRYGVAGNMVTPEKYRNVEINISDVAAGSPNVQIRLYMWGMNNYYWLIDDLALVEAYDRDLILEDTWMDFDDGATSTLDHLHYWPLSQMGMMGDGGTVVGNYYMRGAVLNSGMADSEEAILNVSVLKNGSEVYNTSSSANSIWSLERDTISVDPFLADDYGDYRFDFTTSDESTDEVIKNNTASMHFTVNDTLSHRASFYPEAEDRTSGNTGGWVGGGNAGDMVCVFYNLYEPAEITSITAEIRGFTASDLPQFQFVLFKEVDGERQEWCGSDIVDMDSSYMNRQVTLPILKDGESEFLEPGVYAACVRMWGYPEGDENGSQGISIGRDLSTKFSGCAQYYEFSETHWTGLAGSPLWMIGFNIDAPAGPTEAPVTFNVDMNAHIASGEFIPGTDFVDVAGSFNDWNGSDPLTDEDGDGIYSITLDGFTVASEIEYKYRINANWDTSEFPDGGPNREYTIRYWNDIHNVYNNGETVGVEDISLIESMVVYPNPTSGEFTINIVSSEFSEMNITIMDIQGHVVYKTTVSGITFSELIDENLNKGVYFLSVNNGKEVKVQKVIVQ